MISRLRVKSQGAPLCRTLFGVCLFWLHAVSLVGCLFGHAAAGPWQRGPEERELTSLDLELLGRFSGHGDFPCKMRVSKPELGFDFKFHSSFEAIISNRELDDKGGPIRLVARLKSMKHPEMSSSMVRTIAMNRLQNLDIARETSIRGFMLVGEGEYRLEWFLRDAGGRICFDRSDFKARLSRGDRQVHLSLPPDSGQIVGTGWRNLWVGESTRGSLHLKVLLNVPPFKDPPRPLWPVDISRFFHIVEALGRDPRVSRLDLMAFNLKDRRVLFREEDVPGIDFERFSKAMQAINSHEIAVASLKDGSDTRFLAKLVRDEVANAREGCDAVVFVGPRATLDREVPDEILDGVETSGPPVHYLRFRYTEYGANWKDSISRVVSAGDGREFSILRPRDLWKAVDRVLVDLGRKVNSRNRPQGPKPDRQERAPVQ